MMYLLETVRFITVDSFSMFFLISAVLNLFGIHFICSLPTVDIYVLSLSYCLSLPLSAVLNLFGIHFICSLPTVDIMCCVLW
jgi:hypothetical protein